MKLLLTLLGSVILVQCMRAQSVGEEFYFSLPDTDLEVQTSNAQDFRVQIVVSGLEVPWGVAFLPDGTVLITERPGRLRLVRNGELLPDPVGGVPEVFARGQGGLLDVAIHPDYEENGWIYLAYSKPGDGGGNTAVTRGKLEGNRFVDQEEIFWGEPRTGAGQHFGSRIVFRDGYIYFSIGDRGSMQNGQDLSNHNATVIRLHDDGRVPEDNPFVDDPDAKPEIFAYGLRNIQGMTIHPGTGEIWSAMHGARGGDEINIIRSGLNYGWPSITHGVNYDGSPITPDTARAGMEQPFLHWTPSIAPNGIDFVWGDRYEGWRGDLMVATLRPQYLHRVNLDGNRLVDQEELLQGFGRMRDVEMAPDGFLYVTVESGGRLIRLLPVH
ncbi:MAG: PQQ-dependent sugar dehydrogenase [Balneolaceae bacterium]